MTRNKQTVTDIRAIKLTKAAKPLSRLLVKLFNQYGLDIVLTLLVYYTARGIIRSKLTEKEKLDMIKQCRKTFTASLKSVEKAYQE